MDDNGTKVIPKKQPPLPPNSILPKEMEKDLFHFEGGPESGLPHVNQILETQRSEKAPPVIEKLPVNQPRSDKTMEGKVQRLNQKTKDRENCYIVLYQQQLSVYKGFSKQGKLLHQLPFSHDAEYRFSHKYNDDLLTFYDKTGEEIHLNFLDRQLHSDIYQEWVSTIKIFTDIKREQAEDNTRHDFDEKDYSFKFNLPSLREFGNVYNDKYMTPFQYYPIVDGNPQIKNAVEFQHFYRPNRLMTSYEQECVEEIEKHMTNINRKFIQWAPSRDWSRLFVLSTIPDKDNDNRVDIYLEFYDFNNEKQTILSSPLRINFLSQVLRPQWIRNIDWINKSIASQVKIEASFTADTIVIQHNQTRFKIIHLKSDWTFKEYREFEIENARIESIKLSCQKVYVKSDEFYYEQSVKYLNDKYEALEYHEIRFDKHLIKNTTLKNIITCGIYDILIYDQRVKILSNIKQSIQQDEIAVDDEMIKLLKSHKFISLDHHQIACLSQPFNDKTIRIKIINILQDKLVMCDTREISLKSPKDTEATDCLFNLIKFKVNQYAVFIVTSPSKNEQFYQYYKHVYKNDKYEFAIQRPLKDYINLQQIPHLPLVNINGSQYVNCDRCIDSYQLELDLRLDFKEILNQERENINSQEAVVYYQNFKKYLFRFIEEKEEIIDIQTKSNRIVDSIDIPELKTSIFIESGGENTGILIFQPQFEKLKHLKIKKPIRYKTHQVIYRDASYKVSIILSTDDALYEMQMCFDLAKATFTPLKFIMNFSEAQKDHQIYLHDYFTVSLFIPAPDCCFKHFSLNLEVPREETINIDFEDGKSQITIQQLSSFIQRIAHSQSISIGKLFLEKFKSIIFKNAESFIKKDDKACVFAFQNKIILFEKGVNNLTIMDDQFTVQGTVICSQFPPSIIRIASSMDQGALECIDELNNIFPIPILGDLKDYKSYNERLNYYTKNSRYPMPFQFGLLDGFIAHLDLLSEKLSFYKSDQDKKDGNISAKIEIIAQRESFIDDIFNSKERKDIEEQMNKIEINRLLSYNVNKRMNLITRTKNHAEKDLIYSVLYKHLEITEIKDLPMLIYNTSLDPIKYESILDVLIENKAIKLAQLIVSIAIKQDQIGYIYSRLYQYLEIFSANELQMVFENQIFFFKIPYDCFEEYQVVKNSLIKPFSDYQTFFEIKKNMKNVESQIKPIEEEKAGIEKNDSVHPAEEIEGDKEIEEDKARVKEMKNSIHPEQGKERGYLQITEKNFKKNEVTVPTEYFAINLMNLTKSKNQLLNENHEDHREVTRMLIKIDEIDETIIEKESFQIIIDFKWDSYARKFFSLQLGLFICFIVAFIFDVVAVSKNSHVFSSDDSNQLIPRIISIVIIIPFAIYEIANIVVIRNKYFSSFWNWNDMLLIALYFAYFTTTFARPEQKDILKSLQLLIVIFTFLKFSFLIRIWPKVSFLVRMLIVVIQELIIFLVYFLLVIGGLTIMAFIIMVESGETYNGIKSVAYFVIMLRQSVGDFDTSSIIDGSKEFQILAWFVWLLILIIGNIVFMNFIIAVVSESYEFCMERKTQLINRAKLEMIQECEDLLPDWCFTKKDYFPRFIIIRREQGSSAEGDNSDQWFGFVKQMQKHLQHETNKLNEIFIQNINRSTESTKKEMKTGQEEVKRHLTAEMRNGQEEVKKVTADVAEVKKETAEMKVQINQINLILSTVFKDQIAIMKAQEVQVNQNDKNNENHDKDDKEDSDDDEDY